MPPRRSLRSITPCIVASAGKDDAEPQPVPVPSASGSAAQPASLSELPSYPPDFVRRRLVTFAGIVLGYSCFYLTRNSLTYTAPVMVADKALGISMTDVSKP